MASLLRWRSSRRIARKKGSKELFQLCFRLPWYFFFKLKELKKWPQFFSEMLTAFYAWNYSDGLIARLHSSRFLFQAEMEQASKKAGERRSTRTPGESKKLGRSGEGWGEKELGFSSLVSLPPSAPYFRTRSQFCLNFLRVSFFFFTPSQFRSLRVGFWKHLLRRLPWLWSRISPFFRPLIPDPIQHGSKGNSSFVKNHDSAAYYWVRKETIV